MRVQQVVIEFILNHVDQIFNNGAPGSLENDGNGSSWILPTSPSSFLAIIMAPKDKLGWPFLTLSVGTVCMLITACVPVYGDCACVCVCSKDVVCFQVAVACF